MLEDKDNTMKKLYTLTLAAGLAFGLTACTGEVSTPVKMGTMAEAVKLDVAKTCDVHANGAQNVLNVAKKFNPLAIKKQVQFMRFGAKTSEYIRATQEAIDKGSKTANVKQKKKTVKFDTNYAATRACKFAVRALQQHHEAQTQWRDAVPGDKFTY